VAEEKNEEESAGSDYRVTAAISFVFVGLLSFVWPNIIPFPFWSFWEVKGSLLEAVLFSWPIYLWGGGATALALFTVLNRYVSTPEEIFLDGVWVSVKAGFFEEICFRWLIFLSAIVMLPILDFFLLGFLGLHVLEWIYMGILCPIANFCTFGMLDPYLTGQYGWAAAAAVMSTNSKFRNGHAYLGIIGFVNAWFIGMYFFMLTFKYGLIAAILVHFLYDFIIFSVEALDAYVEKKWLLPKEKRPVFRRRKRA
jgi:hypothetical protein